METFAEKFIGKIPKTELDLEWPFYGPEDVRNEVLTSSQIDCDVPSISTTDLETLITEFKSAGATRMYISTHIDHQGYYFYGVELVKI